MRKIIFAVTILLILAGLSPAQTTKLIFGPRDGENAGVIRAYGSASVDVDVWIRTEPGIQIVGLHLPLSSNSEYIGSRDDGSFLYPLDEWDDAQFLAPNDDPVNDGYTNQSILGVCDSLGGCDPIETDGQWWKIAAYKMTAGPAPQFDTPYCDAFIEGHHPENGGIVLTDYQQGELDPSQYEVEFACLQFEEFCGGYVKGDYSGNGVVNVADLVSAFSYLETGAPEGGVMCQCPPGQGLEFAVAFDLNNTCTFDLVDICVFIRHWPNPYMFIPCEYCAPPQ